MKPRNAVVAVALLLALAIGVMLARVPGDDVPEPVAAPPSVLFVGDSYSSGGYLGVSPEQAFPCQTAQQLRWTCLRDAVGATGYQADGKIFLATADTYEKRLPTTRATYPDPDVIVVSGGRNDDHLLIGSASRAYLTTLRQTYPAARIFVLEPFWMGPVPPDVALSRAAVKASAETAGVTWVPTADWLIPTDLSADWVHPNLAGQQRITQRLVAVLRAASS